MMRTWVILATLAISLALASCAQDRAGGEDQLDQLTIGVSVPTGDHHWTAGVVWWAEQAQRLYPEVNWVFNTADDAGTQIEQVEAMMTQNELDGLVILCQQSGPLDGVGRQAADAGVYIVSVDRGFLAPIADLHIAGDNIAFGRVAAEYMVERLGGQGKVLVLRGVESNVDNDRYNAAMTVFHAAPGVTVVSERGQWSQETAREKTAQVLIAHDDIDAIWAADDDMALGVQQAVAEAGRLDEVWVVGGGGSKEIIGALADPAGQPEGAPGFYAATVTYSPSMIAAGIHLCVSNLRDGRSEQIDRFMPQRIVIPAELITPENAGDYYVPEARY